MSGRAASERGAWLSQVHVSRRAAVQLPAPHSALRRRSMQSALEASSWRGPASVETRAMLRRSASFGAPRKDAGEAAVDRARPWTAPRLPRHPRPSGVPRLCAAAAVRRRRRAASAPLCNYFSSSCACQMQHWEVRRCVLEWPEQQHARPARTAHALAPFPPVRRARRRCHAHPTARRGLAARLVPPERRTAAAPPLRNCPITIAPCARTPAPGPRARGERCRIQRNSAAAGIDSYCIWRHSRHSSSSLRADAAAAGPQG
jgi:hypothetical protein